jgi:hypothetical protein
MMRMLVLVVVFSLILLPAKVHGAAVRVMTS